MARYKIECCYECAARYPGCHGECEKYKQQRSEMDETKAEQKKQYETKKGLDGFMFDNIHRTNKRRNYRNKYRRSR